MNQTQTHGTKRQERKEGEEVKGGRKGRGEERGDKERERERKESPLIIFFPCN